MKSSPNPLWWTYGLVTLLATCHSGYGARVLMATMGGTKSHKIPFLALARGLIQHGHNVTFVNAFPSDSDVSGLEEITPLNFVLYVRNYTNWDLLGMRMSGQEAVPPADVLRYGYYACDALLSDPETHNLMNSGRNYDLVIVDGSYPECPVVLAHHFKVPFMYINTVAFYMTSITHGGSPAPFSVTPFLARSFMDDMDFMNRLLNTVYLSGVEAIHTMFIRWILEPLMRSHIGPNMPSIQNMVKNVSFILQNGHATITYPRPYLPNVAEIACIHCKPAKPLPKDLEEFVSGSENGFIYVSMGSSVLTAKMPEMLRLMFIRVFSLVPYRVLWKWEAGEDSVPDLPDNVRLGRWLPQQDILGHRKIRAFVTHGGLLSMFETVYHGVPIVTMPVFCDHDANSAKSERDGYAIKLELQDITAEKLLWAINEIVRNPKYRDKVKERQQLLRDQQEHPLDRAVYWTEYVLRHKGAYHLQSPAKEYSFIEYYLIDVFSFLVALSVIAAFILVKTTGFVIRISLLYLHNPNRENDDELVNMKRKVKLAMSSETMDKSNYVSSFGTAQKGLISKNGTVTNVNKDMNGLSEKHTSNGYRTFQLNEDSNFRMSDLQPTSN